jgi:hypothetical protein
MRVAFRASSGASVDTARARAAGKSVAWFTRFLLFATLSLYFRAAPGQAQALTAEPAGYKQLMDEAVAEYELRHFAEARALFARGASLFPNARAFRGVGMAEFELRDYADSVDSLERALASDVRPLEGPLRGETEQLLERARRFVGRILFTLEPAETRVLVDNVPVTLGTQRDLRLTVGDHNLELRAEGYLAERRTLKVRGGELDSLHVALTRVDTPALGPLVLAPAAAPVPHDTGSERRPLYKNPWLWTGVGVAVAALATGLAIGLSGGSSSTQRDANSGVLRGP